MKRTFCLALFGLILTTVTTAQESITWKEKYMKVNAMVTWGDVIYIKGERYLMTPSVIESYENVNPGIYGDMLFFTSGGQRYFDWAFDVNLYNLPEEEKAKLQGLPTSLEGALDALEADYAFLTEGGVFPEELIKNFIKTKRDECRQLAAIPHPAEFDKYYNL